MALILKKLYKGYFWAFNEMADPRVENVLVSSPFVVLSIIGSYFYLVLHFGPKFMEKRKPFDLKKILIVYNVTQIIFNVMLVIFGAKALWNIDKKCARVDYSYSPGGLLELRLVSSFYLLKIYDLLDTIFFVLRKSWRQVNFLHVYHHSSMVFGTFLICNFINGGEIIWTGWINVIVHTTMFSYYLLTVIDEKWKENLRFKKFLTQIQLIQFVLNILIYGRLLFKPSCSFPRVVALIYVPQNVFMLSLFGDFYLRNYVFKNKIK